MVSGTVKQVLATAVCGQLLLILGSNMALNSALLIQEAGDGGQLSPSQRTWAISITFAGALLGCALAAVLTPLLGGRRLLLLLLPLAAAGSAAVYLGGKFGWTLAGRLVVNTALGAGDGQARAYVAEVAAPPHRAVISTVISMMMFLGQLAGLALASVCHWKLQGLICACVPAVVGFVGLLLLPDSPQWLLAHGHPEPTAADALRFYRGAEFDAAQEIGHIRSSLGGVEQDGALFRKICRALSQRRTLRPILLTATQFFFFVWTGGFFLVVVTALVVGPARLPLGEYQRAMLVPAVPLVCSLPASLLLRRAGRLPLLRAAGLLSAAGCVAIAAYFLLGERGASSGWLVLVGVFVCLPPYTTIMTPITFNYLGELLPNSVRAFAVNIVLGAFNLVVFVSLQTYDLVIEQIGLGGVFVVHTLLSLLQVVFASTVLPETSGLTLEQIQQRFFDQKPDVKATELETAQQSVPSDEHNDRKD